MMKCERFQELLADLDRPGVLDADVRAAAFAHAEECADCGLLLTETESLDAGLRQLAEKADDAHAAARLETPLVMAFRERKAATRRQTRSRYAAAIGIAAVLLLAIGLWADRAVVSRYHRSNFSPVEQQFASHPQTVAPSQPQITVVGARHNALSAVQERGGASDEALPSAKDVAATDTANTFILLPGADDPSSLDDGAVVRVEMPRAALASFGLPVAAMEGDGTVRADLVVSADGTPQAIRLVSENGRNASQP